MARTTLGSLLDREFRNELNRMLAELYDAVGFITEGTITPEMIANGSITGSKLAAGSIYGDKIANNSIEDGKLMEKTVGDRELKDGAILNSKYATRSITWDKLDEGAVTNSRLSDGAVTNSKIADNTVNGFKIRDNSISRRHMRDKSIDKINFTDELRDEFNMDKMIPFYYEAREIPLNFELGGYYVSGEKITSDNPVNARNSGPIFLPKGTVVTQGDNATDFEYEMIFHNLDGEYTYERTGYIPFGTNYELEEDNVAYLLVRKKSQSVMVAEDLNTIKSQFPSIKLERKDFSEEEILSIIDHFNSGDIKVEFELGGWGTDGNKVTNPTARNLRSTEKIITNKKLSINPPSNQNYEYEVIEYNDDGNAIKNRSGFIAFGAEYKVPESDSDKILVMTIRRVDGEYMSNSDVEFINSLDIRFKNLSKNNSDDSQNLKNHVDKFNIIGKLETFINEDLSDFYLDPNNVTPQEFHDDMISLANENSDIFKYKLLGTDDYNYNMYSYQTTPNVSRKSPSWNIKPSDNEGSPLDIPKIIITSGIHGQERNANYVVYHFMKKLLSGENEVYDTILNNIEFVIIPMCCPSGFVDNTYENRSGANLNRDFPPYGETVQPESGLIKSVIDEHSDADYHIDFHNFTPQTVNEGVLGYALTNDQGLARIATNVYKYLGSRWQKKNVGFPQDRNHQWGYTADANIGTVGEYSRQTHGIPSSIIETARWHTFSEEENHGVEQTQIGVDLLSNVIVGILQARR